MTRRFSLTVVLVPVFATAASAGTIEGKVSPRGSVVYVDAIAGKTLPVPSQMPVINQKGLMFSPILLAVQVGMTVEFEEDDTVQQHVFWPSVGGNEKLGHYLGTRPMGEERRFKFDAQPHHPTGCSF